MSLGDDVGELAPGEIWRLRALGTVMQAALEDERSTDVVFVLSGDDEEATAAAHSIGASDCRSGSGGSGGGGVGNGAGAAPATMQALPALEVRVRAHRALLAATSPVFRAMLCSPAWRESRTLSVRLPGVGARTLSAALRFVYTGALPAGSNAGALVTLARFGHVFEVARLEAAARSAAAAAAGAALRPLEAAAATLAAADAAGTAAGEVLHAELIASARRLLLATAPRWLRTRAALQLPEAALASLLSDDALCCDEAGVLRAIIWRAKRAGAAARVEAAGVGFRGGSGAPGYLDADDGAGDGAGEEDELEAAIAASCAEYYDATARRGNSGGDCSGSAIDGGRGGGGSTATDSPIAADVAAGHAAARGAFRRLLPAVRMWALPAGLLAREALAANLATADALASVERAAASLRRRHSMPDMAHATLASERREEGAPAAAPPTRASELGLAEPALVSTPSTMPVPAPEPATGRRRYWLGYALGLARPSLQVPIAAVQAAPAAVPTNSSLGASLNRGGGGVGGAGRASLPLTPLSPTRRALRLVAAVDAAGARRDAADEAAAAVAAAASSTTAATAVADASADSLDEGSVAQAFAPSRGGTGPRRHRVPRAAATQVLQQQDLEQSRRQLPSHESIGNIAAQASDDAATAADATTFEVRAGDRAQSPTQPLTLSAVRDAGATDESGWLLPRLPPAQPQPVAARHVLPESAAPLPSARGPTQVEPPHSLASPAPVQFHHTLASAAAMLFRFPSPASEGSNERAARTAAAARMRAAEIAAVEAAVREAEQADMREALALSLGQPPPPLPAAATHATASARSFSPAVDVATVAAELRAQQAAAAAAAVARSEAATAAREFAAAQAASAAQAQAHARAVTTQAAADAQAASRAALRRSTGGSSNALGGTRSAAPAAVAARHRAAAAIEAARELRELNTAQLRAGIAASLGQAMLPQTQPQPQTARTGQLLRASAPPTTPAQAAAALRRPPLAAPPPVAMPLPSQPPPAALPHGTLATAAGWPALLPPPPPSPIAPLAPPGAPTFFMASGGAATAAARTVSRARASTEGDAAVRAAALRALLAPAAEAAMSDASVSAGGGDVAAASTRLESAPAPENGGLPAPRSAGFMLPLRCCVAPGAAGVLAQAEAAVGGLGVLHAAVTPAATNALGHDLLRSAVEDAPGGPRLLPRLRGLTWRVLVRRLDAALPLEVKLIVELSPGTVGAGVGEARMDADMGIAPAMSADDAAHGSSPPPLRRYYVAGITLYGGAVLVRSCNGLRLVDPDAPASVAQLCAPGAAEAALAAAPEALIELYLDEGGSGSGSGSGGHGSLRLAVAINGVAVHSFTGLPPAAAWRRLTLSAGTRDLLPMIASDMPPIATGHVAISGLTPLASVSL